MGFRLGANRLAKKAFGMNTAARRTVLQRKVDAARDDQFARAMSLRKALRLTLPKVADDLFGLPVSVIGITQTLVPQTRLADLFDPTSLLVLLDGPQGAMAAVTLNCDLVGAVIQQQTTGTVTPPPAAPRPLTRTDAALCAPMLDAVLARSAALLDIDADRRVFDGFKFGARVEDVRTLGLALDAPDFAVFHLTLDLAGGTRQGDILFCMPNPVPVVPAGAPPLDEQANAAQLGPVVLLAPTELTAVLCKLRMPLSKVQALGIGDVVPVSRAALRDTGVHVQSGRRICVGQLGQSSGYRALRLRLGGAAQPQLHSVETGSDPDPDPAQTHAPQPSDDGDIPSVPAPAAAKADGPAAPFAPLSKTDADRASSLPEQTHNASFE